MFDLPALESALAGTIFAGQLHYSPSTGSTNDDAKAAARDGRERHDGAPHGSVFFADEQTAGRGRGDHAWHSAAGQGLYLSVLLGAPISLEQLTLLPLLAGLAAADAIRTVTALDVDLRWPNDLLIGPRKTGGILVESQTEANKVAFAVVGIGINVHQKQFPTGLATPATSLDLESGQGVSRQDLLVSVLKSLELRIRSLDAPQELERIPRLIEESSTWVRGRRVVVHGPQGCEGITDGLDEHGFLRVRTAEGLVIVRTGGLRDAIS
jgi:BirA family biotin operon repressor/biotin-[acetyl-CoA-carboxylase] ligase